MSANLKPQPRSYRPGQAVAVRLPNWIGDAVMAAPLIQALGMRFPDLEWHLFGGPRTLPLFQGLDLPYRLHALPLSLRGFGSWMEAVESARGVRPRSYLVLPPSFSSALLALLSGAERRVGWPGEGRRALLTDLVAEGGRERHLREQYWDLGQAWARTGPGGSLAGAARRTRLPLRAEEISAAQEWWARCSWVPKETVVIAPGASYGPTKRWPEERFAEAGRHWIGEGRNLLWFGGAEEAELCARLDERMESPGRSQSLAGVSTLRESLALLAGAAVLVSNDSGAMHMAQAVGTPVAAIFGSTSPTWTGPVGSAQRTLYSGRFCSPCFARQCPTEIECLSEVTVPAVLEAVTELTGGGRDSGRPAVFLDRDGTLVDLVPYLHRAEDLRLVPGAGPALRALREKGFALVLVTNQSVIARGTIGPEELEPIHRRLRQLLAEEGVELDAIEVCPHHPEFTGPCRCRKPEPGLLLRAAHHLELDLSRSWMVGDTAGDAGAAAAAGTRFALVRTGYGREIEPSLSGVETFDNLVTASQAICSSLLNDPQR